MFVTCEGVQVGFYFARAARASVVFVYVRSSCIELLHCGQFFEECFEAEGSLGRIFEVCVFRSDLGWVKCLEGERPMNFKALLFDQPCVCSILTTPLAGPFFVCDFFNQCAHRYVQVLVFPFGNEFADIFY
jgi:hypothetical protein